MLSRLRWIGQGGFLLELGDKVLCIDPYLSNAAAQNNTFERMVPPPVQPAELAADVILCTHDHLDHLDEQTLKHTDMSRIRYAGPSSCVRHFRSMGIAHGNIAVVDRGGSLALGEAVITAVAANHTRDSIGVVVRFDGSTLYFTGDSEYDKNLLDIKALHPDVLVVCVNGKLGNMDYRQAAALAVELGVKAAVPCHYGMFAENTVDPRLFDQCLAGSGVRYCELPLNEAVPVAQILSM